MKVLLVYPNNLGYTRVPPGLAILCGVLKKAGHEVQAFDTSFYKIFDENDDKIREKTQQVRKTNLAQHGVVYKPATEKDVLNDFKEKIEYFKPDLIGFSISTEDMADFGFKLASFAKEQFPKALVAFGGIAVTTAPEDFIDKSFIDIVNVGEGEDSILELLESLKNGDHRTDILNMWFKRDGNVIKNDVRPFKNMDDLPYPDFEEFSERHFFRPIDGKVYRTVMVEFIRGCPRRCSYCINHILQNLYQGKGCFIRRKSINRMIDELVFLKNKYNLSLIFFTDDDFLIIPPKELEEFLRLYREKIDLPFLIQSAAPNITEERVKLLREAGCITVCMGVESGNEFIQRRVFERIINNKQLIKGFKIVKEGGLRVSSTNIVGSPYETREMIFDTIKVNREAQPDSVSMSFMTPYKGTKIREIAIKEGYISPNLKIDGGLRAGVVFDMPQITKAELEGLHKTFILYVRLPKSVYPLIKFCEKKNPVSDMIFKILSKWVDKIQEDNRKARFERYNKLMGNLKKYI